MVEEAMKDVSWEATAGLKQVEEAMRIGSPDLKAMMKQQVRCSRWLNNLDLLKGQNLIFVVSVD